MPIEDNKTEENKPEVLSGADVEQSPSSANARAVNPILLAVTGFVFLLFSLLVFNKVYWFAGRALGGPVGKTAAAVSEQADPKHEQQEIQTDKTTTDTAETKL